MSRCSICEAMTDSFGACTYDASHMETRHNAPPPDPTKAALRELVKVVKEMLTIAPDKQTLRTRLDAIEEMLK